MSRFAWAEFVQEAAQERRIGSRQGFSPRFARILFQEVVEALERFEPEAGDRVDQADNTRVESDLSTSDVAGEVAIEVGVWRDENTQEVDGANAGVICRADSLLGLEGEEPVRRETEITSHLIKELGSKEIGEFRRHFGSWWETV